MGLEKIKIKNLTLDCELLWNTIIWKIEPPYYAFTQEPKLILVKPILVGTTVTFQKVASGGKSFHTIPITMEY
jgi:hypothetical protein